MAIVSKSSPASFIITATLSSLLPLAGCSESGTPRLALWGKVTWKGQPVPTGIVFLNPNVSQGNTGPQGYALIRDGVFDTRQSPGRGCVAGSHFVRIYGCNGQNISDERPYGNWLFDPYDTSLDISAEGGEVEVIVPDTVKAISPGTIEPE